MRAFEVVRQIDRQSDRRDCILSSVRFIPDLDREPKIPDTNTVDRNFAVIGKVLGIYKILQMLGLHGFDVPRIAVVIGPEFDHEKELRYPSCKILTSIP
jgi:hypothetical protein